MLPCKVHAACIFLQYLIAEPSLNFQCQLRVGDFTAIQLGVELHEWRKEIAKPPFSFAL